MSNLEDIEGTWIDLVKEYFPSASDKQCDDFMWNCTSFPAGIKHQIYDQIRQAAVESNNNIELAMAQADEVISTAMRQYNEQYGRLQSKC
jgi:hypothetical protein